MKAISIKQPWASLICSGIKDIENRTWACPKKYIGQRVLIHASSDYSLVKQYPTDLFTQEQWDTLNKLDEGFAATLTASFWLFNSCRCQSKDIVTGAIIGSVEIVGCVINHESIWAEKTYMYEYDKFSGKHAIGKPVYNWVLANPILFPEPIPAKGKLSFWEFNLNICCKTNLPCQCSGLCKESY